MLSCKEVTRLISESMDRELPMHQRVAIRLHLSLCTMCRHFEGNMNCLGKMLRRMNEKQVEGTHDHGQCMSESAKARLREKLQAPSGEDVNPGDPK